MPYEIKVLDSELESTFLILTRNTMGQGPDEILPGIVCEAPGGHTEGSMNIIVQTADGIACIFGDVIYAIHTEIVDPIYQVLDHELQSTGNQDTSKRDERAAIKFRLVGDLVPGPEQPVEHKTTADTHEMGLGAGRLWV